MTTLTLNPVVTAVEDDFVVTNADAAVIDRDVLAQVINAILAHPMRTFVKPATIAPVIKANRLGINSAPAKILAIIQEAVDACLAEIDDVLATRADIVERYEYVMDPELVHLRRHFCPHAIEVLEEGVPTFDTFGYFDALRKLVVQLEYAELHIPLIEEWIEGKGSRRSGDPTIALGLRAPGERNPHYQRTGTSKAAKRVGGPRTKAPVASTNKQGGNCNKRG